MSKFLILEVKTAFELIDTIKVSFCCQMLDLTNMEISQALEDGQTACWWIFVDTKVRWFGGSFWKKKIGFEWIDPKGQDNRFKYYMHFLHCISFCKLNSKSPLYFKDVNFQPSTLYFYLKTGRNPSNLFSSILIHYYS